MKEHLIPYEQRQDGTCGEACLVMVYRAYGITTTEEELIREIKPELGFLESKYFGGTSHEQMVASVERHGMKAWHGTDFTYNQLKELSAKGLPVIVEWMTDLDKIAESDCHYSVVAEVNNQYVTIADPSYGEWRKISKNDFERKWMGLERDGSTTRHWFLAVIKP